MADDKFRKGEPERKKRPVAPAASNRPKPRRTDDDDEPPRKKKRRRVEEEYEDDEEEDGDLGSSPVSALIPVGGSAFGLISMWSGVFSLVPAVMALVSAKGFYTIGGHALPGLATVLMPILWPIGLFAGILAFFTHKSKMSYGSIAGNMRAILGILFSLAAMVMHILLIYLYATGKTVVVVP